TMASLIANEFSEASGDAHLSALMAVGFTLFAITIIVNAIARLLVRRVSRGSTPGSTPLVPAPVAPSFTRKWEPRLAGTNVDSPFLLNDDRVTPHRRADNGGGGIHSLRARRARSAAMVVLTAVAAVGATLPLLFILWHLVSTGAGALGVDF